MTKPAAHLVDAVLPRVPVPRRCAPVVSAVARQVAGEQATAGRQGAPGSSVPTFTLQPPTAWDNLARVRIDCGGIAAVANGGGGAVQGGSPKSDRMASPAPATDASDPILDAVRRFYEENHEGIERARRARRYFYGYLTRALRARIPPGQRVLDIGCGSGHLLAALEPSHGVGIDLSGRRDGGGAARLRGRRPPLPRGRRRRSRGARAGRRALRRRSCSSTWSPTSTDVQATLEACAPSATRARASSSTATAGSGSRCCGSAELLGLKYRPPPEAWLPPEEIAQHAAPRGLRGGARGTAQIVFPAYVPLLSDLLNRYVGQLPGRRVALADVRHRRPARARTASPAADRPTRARASIIPCRNEAGPHPAAGARACPTWARAASSSSWRATRPTTPRR